MKIFGREPTLVLQTIQGLLALLVTFQFPWLTEEHAGLWVAAIAALFASINGWMVKPTSPAVFVGVVLAGAALISGYGFDLKPEMVGAVNGALTALLTLAFRNQVTPEADPLPGGGVPVAVAGPPVRPYDL